MGLLARALSAQSLISTRKGLLRRCYELLEAGNKKTKLHAYPTITQEELNALITARHQISQQGEGRLHKAASSPGKGRARFTLEPIPLTWKEVGYDRPPQNLGPLINPQELSQALMNQDKGHRVDMKNIFQELAGFGDGIEAPAHLFTLLQKNLHFTKAALLLYDPLRMVFAPWASIGYDETTLHRLRIPLGFNRDFDRLARGTGIYLTGEPELRGFKGCFSSREYATLERLIFVPFIHQDKLIAALLVSQIKDQPAADILELFHEIARQASPMIFRARQGKLKALRDQSLGEPESVEGRVRELAQDCRDKGLRLLMMKFSIDPVIQKISGSNQLLDPFRLKEDIVRVINSLVYEIGSAYHLNQHHLLLVVHTLQEPDPELLMHHLERTLKILFTELAEQDHIDLHQKVRIFPAGSKNVLELLAELT